MNRPKDGRVMNPKFILPASYSGGGAVPTDTRRRLTYAEWLTAKDNPFFAKSTVNRVWSYFFGRGIIDPVDDIRASNPPSHPALLDALTKDFLDHEFDLRQLMRTIANSRVYQSSIATNEWNQNDTDNFSHAIPRRISAEALMDALALATGVRPAFPEAPRRRAPSRSPIRTSARTASSISSAGPRANRRASARRRSDLSLPQALNLVNGRTISDAVADSNGRVAKAVLSGRPDADVSPNCIWRRSAARPPLPSLRAA
jgi:hypothetical protein